MHGVCMWKYEPISGRSGNESATTISNLVNWMDQRCDTQFLSALPCPTSHLKLSSGHGCATLFWLQEHKPEEIAKYDSAGTIMVNSIQQSLTSPPHFVRQHLMRKHGSFVLSLGSPCGYPV